MKILYLLADTFIDTFGITRPTATTRRYAAFFILGLIIALLLGVSVAGILLQHAMR